MNCTTETKEWIIYDAKEKVFLEFSNQEFKDFVIARPKFSPIKWKDAKIWDRNKQKKVWIDGLINAEDFK